jgi:glutaredoxin
MVVYVYSLENCPRCEELKEYIGSIGIEYLERNMQTAESIAELRCNQVFAVEAPVLQVGEDLFFDHTTLYPDGNLNKGMIKKVLAE